MKVALALTLLGFLLVAGCAHKQKAKFPAVPGASGGGTSSASGPVITPSTGLTGKVSVYNSAGRFVVLEFPIGHLPALEQRLFIYRGGLKVGEVKVTGPQKDDHIIADLISGEAAAGDEVRDK